MIDGNHYANKSLLNEDIQKWKAIVILKFASKRQCWVELVGCVEKAIALWSEGENYKNVNVPFVKYWFVADF